MPPVQIEHRLISREEKVFTFLVVFMAWANVYTLPGIPLGIGELLLLLFMPLYYKKNMNFCLQDYEKGFFLWLVYTTLVTLVVFNYFNAPLDKLFSIARVACYWIFIFAFGSRLFNVDCFKKWMLVFAIGLSFFIALQSLVYAVSHVLIPGFFLNASLNDGGMTGLQIYDRYLQMAQWTGYIRPNGFLCEPSHCSQFLFICLMFVITDTKFSFVQKNLLALFFSISIILTTSTTGMLLLFFAWFVYMSIEKKLSFFRVPMTIFLGVAILMLVSGRVGIENNVLERITNIVEDHNVDHSSSLRLNNGKIMFLELPLLMKFFGTGFGMVNYVMDSLGISNYSPYINAFYVIPFMSGLLGTVIWYFCMIMLYRKSNLRGKTLIFGFIVLSLGSGVFSTAQMVWFFMLILDDIKEKNGRYSGIELQ